MRPPWKVVSVSLRYVRDFSFCFIYRDVKLKLGIGKIELGIGKIKLGIGKIKLGRWFTKWTSVIIGLSRMSDGENDSIT